MALLKIKKYLISDYGFTGLWFYYKYICNISVPQLKCQDTTGVVTAEFNQEFDNITKKFLGYNFRLTLEIPSLDIAVFRESIVQDWDFNSIFKLFHEISFITLNNSICLKGVYINNFEIDSFVSNFYVMYDGFGAPGKLALVSGSPDADFSKICIFYNISSGYSGDYAGQFSITTLVGDICNGGITEASLAPSSRADLRLCSNHLYIEEDVYGVVSLDRIWTDNDYCNNAPIISFDFIDNYYDYGTYIIPPIKTFCNSKTSILSIAEQMMDTWIGGQEWGKYVEL